MFFEFFYLSAHGKRATRWVALDRQLSNIPLYQAN